VHKQDIPRCHKRLTQTKCASMKIGCSQMISRSPQPAAQSLAINRTGSGQTQNLSNLNRTGSGQTQVSLSGSAGVLGLLSRMNDITIDNTAMLMHLYVQRNERKWERGKESENKQETGTCTHSTQAHTHTPAQDCKHHDTPHAHVN